jgi:hypothetical protein
VHKQKEEVSVGIQLRTRQYIPEDPEFEAYRLLGLPNTEQWSLCFILKLLDFMCIDHLLSYSSGYDEVTSKILKPCLALISCPVAYICNHSQHKGIFLDHPKISVVKPLYKKRWQN